GRRDVRVDLDDAPGEIGALASAFDRMAAAVDKEDQLRRQLVADVAHEVRTPLSILQGTTEALVDGVLPPDPATLASLHDAGLRLVLESLDLADEVRAVVGGAEASAAAGELTLDVSLEPAPVVGDARRLRQLTTTLVAKALAYTPPGGTIQVSTRTDGHQVLL